MKTASIAEEFQISVSYHLCHKVLSDLIRVTRKTDSSLSAYAIFGMGNVRGGIEFCSLAVK